MRIALVMTVVAFALAGCSSGAGEPGACSAYGHPANGLCAQSWDWYRPCDLVEGRAWRDCACASPCGGCGSGPCGHPGRCGCGMVETRVIHQPVVPPPPGQPVPPAGAVIIDGAPPPPR